MPNIYVPEEIFKKYVERYGYNEVKEKMVELLSKFINEDKQEIPGIQEG